MNMNQMSQEQFKFQKSKLNVETKGSYILDSRICCTESYKLEFKNYQWPFTQDLEFTLMKVICGFLNRSGGTILIGVNDQRLIKGIQIKNIDELKLFFDNLKKKFYPLPTGLIKTVEIPIKQYVGANQEEYQWLPSTYVVRIEVSQGYLDKLYTFKFQYRDQQEKLYSSFREDASLVTINNFEEIYERIYQKAIRPESKAKAIIYDEPDQNGFQESLVVHQPQKHGLKRKFLAFTNIFRNKTEEFKTYMENYLIKENIRDFVINILSEHMIIIESKRIEKIEQLISNIPKDSKQILTLTYKSQPLQFGYISNVTTIKGISNNTNNEEILTLLDELDYDYKFKDNGDLVIYTNKNMKSVPEFYQYCKFNNLQIYIKFD